MMESPSPPSPEALPPSPSPGPDPDEQGQGQAVAVEEEAAHQEQGQEQGQEASPVSSSSDEEEQQQQEQQQQEPPRLSAGQALLRDPLARLPQAGAEVVFERCLAFLQRVVVGPDAAEEGAGAGHSESAEQVEGLFMLQPSLTDVRRLQRRILLGGCAHAWRAPSLTIQITDPRIHPPSQPPRRANRGGGAATAAAAKARGGGGGGGRRRGGRGAGAPASWRLSLPARGGHAPPAAPAGTVA